MLGIPSIRPAISSYLLYLWNWVCKFVCVRVCVCLCRRVSNKISAGSLQPEVIPLWNVLKALRIPPPAQNSASLSHNLLLHFLMLSFPSESLLLISICHSISFIRCHLQPTPLRCAFHICMNNEMLLLVEHRDRFFMYKVHSNDYYISFLSHLQFLSQFLAHYTILLLWGQTESIQ